MVLFPYDPVPADTRAAIVRAAVEAACLTAEADSASGRQVDTLTSADRRIVADLAERLAVRSSLVRALPARQRDDGAGVFRAAYVRGYQLHLADLAALSQGVGARDVDQLAHDVLAALEAISRAQGEGGT